MSQYILIILLYKFGALINIQCRKPLISQTNLVFPTKHTYKKIYISENLVLNSLDKRFLQTYIIFKNIIIQCISKLQILSNYD